MAKFNLICTTFLFLLVVLSHEVITSEGRPLRPESQRASKRLVTEDHKKMSNSFNSVHHASVRKAHPESTDPGHSPGVGHAATHIEANN
ncbi:uncharacterized protein J3R85_003661 [Psidium guajava]|nr:uncharacterized protein J3R85_003661 [Psidium guajava]